MIYTPDTGKKIGYEVKLIMMEKKQLISIGVTLVFCLTIIITVLLLSDRVSFSLNNEVLVTRVIDGDTIELETGERVRYIGIDTPETVHPFRPVECFGEEASSRNKELVEGKKVRLKKDVSDKDVFNRLLRYVYVEDVFVNELLVREGYATAVSYPPDISYQELFLEAEREARENKRGLWADGVCDEF